MFTPNIAIDLGTSNVLIYIPNKGIVLNEPTVVAVERKTNKIIAAGKEALTMVGRTPGKIKTINPIENGVITDIELTEDMLLEFIKKINQPQLLSRPKILLCYPSKITQIEKDSIKEVAETAGAKKAYIEEEPKMSALGAGIDIEKPTAHMIVDIGGGTTNIAVISLGDIVISNTINIGGVEFNKQIINYIKTKYKILIGEITAEQVKTKFANVYNSDMTKTFEIKGRDLITGLPQILKITEADTENALEEVVEKITSEIINILEITPPELSADITETGIVLSGGSSLLKGLREKLENRLKLPVFITQNSLTCTIDGLGITLEDISKYEKDL